MPMRFVIGLAVVAALVWFLQSEANDLELGRELRALPGGEAWMSEVGAWVDAGAGRESRAIWLGEVDELVRTQPEVGEPELLALKLVGVVGIDGDVKRASPKLYVSARGFDFVANGLDEPLSGHRWLVATFENEHGQRHLHAAIPAPPGGGSGGEVAD